MNGCLCCGAPPERSELVRTTSAHMYHGEAGPFRFVRCTDCGLTYLSPRVPPDELGPFYPDWYLPYRGAAAWGRYAAFAARGQRMTDEKRISRAGRHLRRFDHAHVLDVGCGRPTFLRRLVDRFPGTVATGIDFVDTGWREESDDWPGINLVQADPAEFNSPERYDLITMWHYLEHDYHPVETLRRLCTVADDTTRLLVEVPDLESISRRWYGSSWEGWHAPRHTAIYSGETLRETLNRGGWEVIHSSTRGTLDTFALWWMSSMECRGIDWTASMESRFIPFMVGKILTAPLFLLEGLLPLGVQLVEARPQSG